METEAAPFDASNPAHRELFRSQLSQHGAAGAGILSGLLDYIDELESRVSEFEDRLYEFMELEDADRGG